MRSSRREEYEERLRDTVGKRLVPAHIRRNQEAVEVMKLLIRQQTVQVRKAEQNVEAAVHRLKAAMIERKTQERLREKAFAASDTLGSRYFSTGTSFSIGRRLVPRFPTSIFIKKPKVARQISSLEAENERLRTFEEEQEEFARLKREFDRNVVFNPKAPEIDYYAKFYEAIYPVTAEEIYRLPALQLLYSLHRFFHIPVRIILLPGKLLIRRQVIEKQQYDQAIQTEAKRLSSMKPGNAAKILEEMNASMELAPDAFAPVFGRWPTAAAPERAFTPVVVIRILLS